MNGFGRRSVALLVALVVVMNGLTLSGGGAAQAEEPAAADVKDLRGTITIGSKTDTETRLLAEIMAQLIEGRTGLKVKRRLGLGGTLIVFEALVHGQIDIAPEYTGTAWEAILKRTDDVHDALKAYVIVSEEFAKRWDLIWLGPFGFSNSYGLAMMKKRAAKLGVSDITQLAEHSGELVAGFDAEFMERRDCFPGLKKEYGLHFKRTVTMDHGLLYDALRNGKVDVVDVYTTDGKLIRYPFEILHDNKHFFPPYDAAPLIRGETLKQYPALGPLLDELQFTITADEMRTMNAAAEEGRGDFDEVARRFLERHGLVGAGGAKRKLVSAAPSFGEFLKARLEATPILLAQHLWLTFSSVILAILVAVPLGILIARRKRLAGPTLGVSGVIQTIPSLALLAFMIPIPGLGLSSRSAILALFLYALLPILRNTYLGLLSVDPELVEAARGMGLTYKQILFRVRLPLASRAIMTGIRTATVISIGVATLAAFIGAGGLGEPIITGLNMNDNWLILSGAIPAALLAVIADYGLGWVEHGVTPRGLRLQESR